MTEIKPLIVKYLNDDEYYQIKLKDVKSKRKYTNYYCSRKNGERIPLKEIGDIFGMFEEHDNDHTDKILLQLLGMNIPVYAKRKYKTVELKYKHAIENGLLIFEMDC
ncbi:hypothetical protein [Fictibacillus sp. FJAT-27399]|uniref:hypothetical protein n=1 Tax=Fictibacillus sp. FJAT-27399 TaxID=1729689 RepID=UPI0007818D92|nr:hypothetical protein [Fictibacillus sp. FJAT-27399]